jgi:superfamily II DNA or RNA helicase
MALNKEGLPKLYKFQNQDLKEWYYTMNRRGILDWEVGTGKGFIGARVVRGYVKDNKSVLILTSNALIPDWIENVEEHNIPIKNLMKKTKKELSKKADVYICSYDSLKNHTYLKPNLIIGDEVHKCRSYGSSRGKVFRKMAQEADDLLMMSGTLWQHSDAVELLNYLWCLNTPEVLYKIPQNITRFREEYCSMITGANNMRWYVTNKRGAELVEDVIKKHILTRETRKELEIPELIEQKISVESEYSFKEMTKKLSKEMDMAIDSSYEKPHITHALMLANGMDFETRELKKDDKIKTVMELLSNIPEDRQVILWYYWKDYKNFLADALDKAGISYDIASGGMTPEKKKDVTDRFREGGFRVLVASQGTLAEGFNLQNANYSIFVNIWYDYIKYAQAIGRIERNGQKNKMVNYMLVGKGSMEEEAYKVLKKKMTLDEAKDFLHGVMMKKLGGKR